jgi:excisionase family DNA binding protein
MDKYYKPDEVAMMLSINYRKVLEEILSGTLKAVKIGRQYRISELDLNRYLAQNKV